MIEISGTTRIFPVIGWPVEQVKAPALFNAYFKRHNIDARVVPLKVKPEAYIEAVRMLMSFENVGGIFVSIPHKPASVSAVTRATERAALAGSCNSIFRDANGVLTGDLIDGEGFIRAFDRTCAGNGPNPATSRALVVGTGGVGCAIAYALAERGFSQVAICDTRVEQAAALQARLQQAFPKVQITIGTPQAAGYDVVVNATPLGMHADDPAPIDLQGVSKDCIVADCGMKIENTKLLRQAQELGCRIQKGKEMLIEQAPLYLEHFGWPGVSSDEFRALEAV